MIFPGLALFLTVMAVNLVGDRLSLVLDPASADMTDADRPWCSHAPLC
jgi:hypothetical protein